MRKTADCRIFPSESHCSLTISGTEDEVVRAAAEHAASVHGHTNTPELQEQIRSTLADETPAGRYGTVMIATLTGSLEALQRATRMWADNHDVPGFLSDEILVSDDGKKIVTSVFFSSREHYQRLADDPRQDEWWNEMMAPHLSDVTWIDGTWQEAVAHQPAHA